MKKSISILSILIILITACRAQQPVAKISSGQVKISGFSYKISKIANKYTVIKNTNDRLTDVEQFGPHLPKEARTTYHMIVDKKLLIKICADVISLSTLKRLAIGTNDRLSMYAKVNEYGVPIEIEFTVDNKSLITLDELRKIENRLKNGEFKIRFDKEIQPYIKGVNYFPISLGVSYSDMLKAKEGN